VTSRRTDPPIRTRQTVVVTVLRDQVAALIQHRGHLIPWAARSALVEAHDYLTITAPDPLPGGPAPGPDAAESTLAAVTRIRCRLLALIDPTTGRTRDGSDPYAIGFAAGQLNQALQELHPRPAA
jgi:hypothetical protein